MPARVLIVDPRADRRRLIAGTLEREGHGVLAAPNLASAIDHLTVDRFDLVLVCEDPGALEVLDAVKTLRKRKAARELPVLALAEPQGDAYEIAVLRAGASDFLRLPPRLAVLAARVQAHLGGRGEAASQGRAPADDEIGPGTVLDGKYAVGDLIGIGGFGRVYRGHHVHLDRPVAVKVMQSSHAWAANSVRRFQLEGSSTCKVDHPNAVQVFDFGLGPGGVPYLVMELLRGKTVFDLLDELGGKTLVEVRRAAEIVLPVCEMLSHAHGVGLMHRDINPSNIFLDVSSGREVVKVLDFGVAKFFDSREKLTEEGVVLGVPHYTAPERHLGHDYGAPADVYSVGVVLFELLTDGYPFRYDTEAPMEVALAPVTQTAARLSTKRPDAPAALESLLESMLKPNPSERPGLPEVSRVLREIIEPPTPGRPRRATQATPLWVSPAKRG